MERRYGLARPTSATATSPVTTRRSTAGELIPRWGSEREFPRLPFILIVIDELSDPHDGRRPAMSKTRSVRIAQMARARRHPPRDRDANGRRFNVITGVIKANIPARLAFRGLVGH